MQKLNFCRIAGVDLCYNDTTIEEKIALNGITNLLIGNSASTTAVKTVIVILYNRVGLNTLIITPM